MQKGKKSIEMGSLSVPKPTYFQFCFQILVEVLILSSLLAVVSAQQLTPSQSKTLLRLQRLLGHPPELDGWSNSTAFCSLPSSPSLSLSCSGGRLTGLTIVGSGRLANHLPPQFSSDSLFTTLAGISGGLTTLSLVSLGLWGSLPGKVDRFTSLKLLNLSSNQFSGELPPELSNMTWLQDLVLSKNSFNGTVPDFNSFGQLRRLDLSANGLTSRIPGAVFSLPAIQYISLSGNKLTGDLPAGVSCSSNLKFVDISDNLLTGKLPSCMSSNSSNLVVLSSENCLKSENGTSQHSRAYCHDPALAAILPPANKIGGSKSNLGLILGIAGGVVAAGVLVALVIFVAFRRARADDPEGNYFIQKPPSVSGSSFSSQTAPRVPRSTLADARHLYQAAKIGTYGMAPYRILSMEELEEATNGFDQSNLIADELQGKFYKGTLEDGTMVVIRCLTLKQKIPPHLLHQYIGIISKLRHRHLVSILGHGLADSSQDGLNSETTIFLVSEFVDNGSLRNHLTEWRKREMLKWPQRVGAAIGIARGLQLLHTVMVPGVVGNDLNIENILLDRTLTAKISNYNLPMLPKTKKNKPGSETPFIGIEERDLVSLGQGQKDDIYQFGQILLEIITGKPLGSNERFDSLKAQLRKSLQESDTNLKEMADSSIHGTFAVDSLRTAVELSLNCVSEDPNERPSIDDVIWNLQYSVQVQNGWASSENLGLHLSS